MIERALTQNGTMWDAEMGTGKSRAAVELWERMKRPKTIVVAPLSVVRSVWPNQFEEWAKAPVNIAIVDSRVRAKFGMTVNQRREEIARGAEVLITNYDLIWRKPFGEKLLKMGFELLIMDESHRIKAPGGKASRFMSRLADRIPKRVALTGTPAPHSPLDVYAQYRALDKSIFGTSNALFKSRYAVMGGFEKHQVVGYQNEDELRSKFDSIAVKVAADDVLSLPESTDSVRSFDLGSKAAKFYRDAETQFLVELESGLVTVANALVKLLRLQQITSGFLIPENSETPEVVDDGKRGVIADILEDAGESHIVVFCRFTFDIAAVRDTANSLGLKSFAFSGAVKQLDEWRENGGVLAVQIQAGGLGIDLTAARLVAYYSLGFSLGDYLQSRARILRPGQTRNVHYIHIAAKHTIDEKVLNSLARRQNVIEEIIYGGKR